MLILYLYCHSFYLHFIHVACMLVLLDVKSNHDFFKRCDHGLKKDEIMIFKKMQS